MARKISPVMGGLLGAASGISAMLRGQIAGLEARQRAKREEEEARLRRDQIGFEFQRLRQQRELTLKDLKQRAESLEESRRQHGVDTDLKKRQLDIMQEGNFLDFYASMARTRTSTGGATDKLGLGEISDADFQKHFLGTIEDRRERLLESPDFATGGLAGTKRTFKPEARHFGTMLDVFKEPESVAAETLAFRQKRDIVSTFGKMAPAVEELMRMWDETMSPEEVVDRLTAVSSDLSTLYGEAANDPQRKQQIALLHQNLIDRYRGLATEEGRRLNRLNELGIPGFAADVTSLSVPSPTPLIQSTGRLNPFDVGNK